MPSLPKHLHFYDNLWGQTDTHGKLERVMSELANTTDNLIEGKILLDSTTVFYQRPLLAGRCPLAATQRPLSAGHLPPTAYRRPLRVERSSPAGRLPPQRRPRMENGGSGRRWRRAAGGGRRPRRAAVAASGGATARATSAPATSDMVGRARLGVAASAEHVAEGTQRKWRAHTSQSHGLDE